MGFEPGKSREAARRFDCSHGGKAGTCEQNAGQRPALREDGIPINVPQTPFYFETRTLVAWYPVAVGSSNWPTPLGTSRIATKQTDPVWGVPVSIQDEVRRNGQTVRKRVAPVSGVRPTS